METTLFLITILLASTVFSQSQPWRTVEKNGMSFSWRVEGNILEGKLKSPAFGWVAVGFNDKPGIVGSNLIMTRCVNGEGYGEDQFVTGMGVHPTIESLDGHPGLTIFDGNEDEEGTWVYFQLDLTEDGYHYLFGPGETCYFTLAYSVADEFDHHSRMRTEVEIEW